LSLIRNPDGKKRFEWVDGKLFQRSLLNPGLEWEMSLLKDFVDPDHGDYNKKAARAKLVSSDTTTQDWGRHVEEEDRAHKYDEMLCYTCHTSWTTSCGGCHLTIQANWKTDTHHYEGEETRSYATYNPQVTRDQMFQLGKHGEVKDYKIAPVRSSSALVLSSRNSNRELIYIQQPPIASSGFSSQAFAPHFPHTSRLTETKTCTDCHLSRKNDNNAIMAQLLLHGTKFVDFLGYNAWVGGDGEFNAIRVTEWEEPQAVLGSYLHRYAYPKSGRAACLQNRGEYLFVAEGKAGTRVYDIANIANKAYSERIITAPASNLGHNTNIPSENATCVVLPTTQPIAPERNQGDLMRKVNLEQPFHPIYNYAFITDSVDGLIVTDVNTLADGEARNNFLERALTWNPNGLLTGARHLTIAGYWFYIATDHGLVILNMDDPLAPQHVTTLDLPDVRASQVQFRYLFVTTSVGMQVVDVTHPDKPRIIPGAQVELRDAQKLHLARTYAYVAAGAEGLAIIDITNPEKPWTYMMYNDNGQINDAQDVIVASTNASAYAYVADGRNGLKIVHLTAPDRQPNFYGYSPEPKPIVIAWYATKKPALSLNRPLERDRAVDETGGQVAVFGRIGSRPFTLEEQQQLYLDDDGNPWYVTDDPDEANVAEKEQAESGEKAAPVGASPRK
jgi:hypothetical protein